MRTSMRPDGSTKDLSPGALLRGYQAKMDSMNYANAIQTHPKSDIKKQLNLTAQIEAMQRNTSATDLTKSQYSTRQSQVSTREKSGTIKH